MAAYSSEPGTARILTDRHKSRYLDDRCPEIRTQALEQQPGAVARCSSPTVKEGS